MTSEMRFDLSGASFFLDKLFRNFVMAVMIYKYCIEIFILFNTYYQITININNINVESLVIINVESLVKLHHEAYNKLS